jgi:amino acid adenylation domain-containing protein
MLAGPEGERLWDYWQHQLAGAPQTLDLPTDRPRPPIQTFHGGIERLTLSDELAHRLRALAQTEGATLYMALLAAFQVLLFRYSGQDDFLIGSPTAGRGRAQLADLVGYFVNPVALRADLSGSPSFSDVVRRVRQTALGALKHQEYPFALLVERLQPLRDPSRSPLFQVMFVLEKAQRLAPQSAPVLAQGRAGARLELADITLEPVELDPQAAQFDLMLMVEEAGATLAATLHYNSDLFEATTIVHMARVFQSLLAQLVDQPDQPVATVPLLSEEQRRQLLVDWNTTAARVPPVQGIHHMVAAQAARTPDAVALAVGEQRLTYRELDQRVNRLAQHLQRLGVGPDGLVGICMDRSADLVVALLAVLKAGGAYLPLDPAYPAERLQSMLEDAQPRVVLVATNEERGTRNEERGTRNEDGRRTTIGAERSDAGIPSVVDPFDFARDKPWSVVDLIADGPTIAQAADTAPDSGITPDNLAYVIYTSGSTGRPKGVAITHRNAVALIQWAHLFFAPEELAGVLASTSICFDLSIFELFVPLSRGGTVIVCENLLQLPALPAAQQVTLINTVPSAMAELLRFGDLPPTVRTVNLAGEPLPNRLAQHIYQQPTVQRVLNLYGPSEDTTYSTVALVERGADDMPPIGRPIANTQVYLLDDRLQPAPVGVPGEVYIGGAGLARGYLNRPALTAECFIPDPFGEAPGARLYRTGDLARFRPDGTIEYLRRIDHQVKIRGYRIELGEIEALLSRHPAVSEAAVIAREEVPGDKRLVAYVVPKDEGGRRKAEDAVRSVSPSAFSLQPSAFLRAWLHDRLPDYMVPSAFVALDSMPLTPNGKLNRRALPPPDQSRPALAQLYVAPSTPVEEALARIWAGVLGLDRVGVNDNFFELGGHSLLATQVLARVRESFPAELPLHSLFEEPTVARLAQTIEQLRNESNERASSSIHARPRGSNRREQLLAQIAQLSEQEASQLLQEKKGAQHP